MQLRLFHPKNENRANIFSPSFSLGFILGSTLGVATPRLEIPYLYPVIAGIIAILSGLNAPHFRDRAINMNIGVVLGFLISNYLANSNQLEHEASPYFGK
ncbi:MAG TPA: hypothetical protein VHA13_06070 [Gammaproteobacteria bacterium]|nr:hypothetical protein [Gammaproteobacteria bacterium]